MLVSTVMATVGAVGVAFYLRFLLALWKDSKRGAIGYWVRLRTDAKEEDATDVHAQGQSAIRAA